MNNTIELVNEMVGNFTGNLTNATPGPGYVWASPTSGEMLTAFLIMVGIALLGLAIYYIKDYFDKKGSK